MKHLRNKTLKFFSLVTTKRSISLYLNLSSLKLNPFIYPSPPSSGFSQTLIHLESKTFACESPFVQKLLSNPFSLTNPIKPSNLLRRSSQVCTSSPYSSTRR